MTAVRRSIAALAATVALVTPWLAAPAHAHHGYEGPVRLYLESVRLEPQGEQWLIRSSLNDTGSGKPAPGFIVSATGSGPQGASFGPVPLTDVDADGRYEAGLGPLPAGEWSLVLDVGDAPGGAERAIPLTKTWNVAVEPGQALDVTGRRAPAENAGSRSGTNVVAPALAVAGLAALLGLTATWLRRRRHPAGGGYEVHHA
jgi:hypothetical protein